MNFNDVRVATTIIRRGFTLGTNASKQRHVQHSLLTFFPPFEPLLRHVETSLSRLLPFPSKLYLMDQTAFITGGRVNSAFTRLSAFSRVAQVTLPPHDTRTMPKLATD